MNERTTAIGVALIGLGKVGLTVAEGIAERPDLDLVAAVDLDPRRVGRDLDEILGEGIATVPGIEVSAELPAAARPDVAFVMTGSRIEQLGATIEGLLERGINVISSAEELAYPWHEYPEWSERLDAAAKRNGVSVMGAGVNPGFLMDALPILLSAVSQRIERIEIKRTIDLRPHRPERLVRFGLGLSPAEFEAAVGNSVYGHVGFRQSIDAVTDSLGWPAGAEFEESWPEPAVFASAPRRGELATIESGEVAVVRQRASASFDGETRIELEEHFGFVDPDDPIPMGDRLTLAGVDQSFAVVIEPGLFSFASTPAVLLNLAAPLCAAAPGLRSTADLAVRSFAAAR